MRIDPTLIHAVVLAGGHSRRMGADKAHLPHPETGQPLLERQVELVKQVAKGACFVSARTQQVLPPLPADVIRVEDDGSAGPLAGIVAAGAAARGGSLLIVPVDLPFLTVAVLRILVEACPTVDHGGFALSLRGPEPLVSLVPGKLHSALQNALDRGELGLAKLFLSSLADTMRPVAVAETRPFHNWNRPTDI